MGGDPGRLTNMISAAAAETHTFARVRRNGYDPNEVDAVVSRLVEDLHHAESQIEELTEQAAQRRRYGTSNATSGKSPEMKHLVDALS